MLISWVVRDPASSGILIAAPASDSSRSVQGWYSVPSEVSVFSDVGVPSGIRILAKVLTSVGIPASIKIPVRIPATFWIPIRIPVSIRIPVRIPASIRASPGVRILQ